MPTVILSEFCGQSLSMLNGETLAVLIVYIDNPE